MRCPLTLAVCAAVVLVASCARNEPGTASRSAPAVTVDTTLVGRVVRINAGLRYVVANFPVGRLPAPRQILHVYRNGQKVGEVRVDERWRRDDNVVADIIVGDALEGDEVRDR